MSGNFIGAHSVQPFGRRFGPPRIISFIETNILVACLLSVVISSRLFSMAHIEISPKQFQVRIYGRHPDNYDASFQLYVDGDKGFVHSLTGSGFYRLMPEFVRKVFETCGVRTVEAYVLEPHARLMKRMFRGKVNMELLSMGTVAGRKMIWVRLSEHVARSCSSSEQGKGADVFLRNWIPEV